MVEAKGATDDEADLLVAAFDASVGEAVAKGGGDAGSVLGDGSGRLHEGCRSGAARPLGPAVEAGQSAPCRELEYIAQLLLQQVGTEERLVGALDLNQGRLLALGEVLGVVPECPAGTLESVSQARLASLAGGIPDLAADLVEGVAGPTHHVKWVSALDGVEAALVDHAHDPGGPVPAHPSDPATALVPQGIEEPGQGGPDPPLREPGRLGLPRSGRARQLRHASPTIRPRASRRSAPNQTCHGICDAKSSCAPRRSCMQSR